MIHIGVADDEPLFLAGPAILLDAQENMEVSWRVGNREEVLDLTARPPVDILLLDAQMPLCDGLEATRHFISRGLSGRIVILATLDTEGYILGAVEAGASDFLLKSTPPQSLIGAIRALTSGGSVISPGPARCLIRAIRETAAPSRTLRECAPSEPISAELAEREVGVLAFIVWELTNQEVCGRLWVSMPTVKTHVSHLLTETGARGRVQPVLYTSCTGATDLDSVLAQGHWFSSPMLAFSSAARSTLADASPKWRKDGDMPQIDSHDTPAPPHKLALAGGKSGACGGFLRVHENPATTVAGSYAILLGSDVRTFVMVRATLAAIATLAVPLRHVGFLIALGELG